MSDEIEKADLGRFCNNVLSALMSSMSEKSRGYKHVFVSTRKIGDKFKAVAVRTSYGEVLKEAADRLRNVTARSDNSAVIAELQRRLKVAEDALTKLQDRFVSSVHDGTIDPYEALKIVEDAIAAIREEGVEDEGK